MANLTNSSVVNPTSGHDDRLEYLPFYPPALRGQMAYQVFHNGQLVGAIASVVDVELGSREWGTSCGPNYDVWITQVHSQDLILKCLLSPQC